MIPACGTSARSLTGCPVSATPPYSASLPTRAAASRAEPPRTTGQPTWCASAASNRPYPPVIGRWRSTMECAAIPASTARPRSPPNRVRPSTVAGRPPNTPYRASRSGAGGGDSGESRLSTSPNPPRAAAPTVSRQARASRREPSPSAVLATSRCTSTASCPSSGWAAWTAGNAHSTGRLRSRNAADARASGSAVAHQSWVNPPSPVSCPLRRPPPNSSAASTSSTFRPASASVTAPISPFGPDPTTTASNPSAWLTGVPVLSLHGHYTVTGGHRDRVLATPSIMRGLPASGYSGRRPP